MRKTFVLIHSPLVGPDTWQPVAHRLRARGIDVLVPEIAEAGDGSFWQRHAGSVARQLAAVPDERPLVLAGHSGAGPLLPAIGELSRKTIAAYLFVDAGLPHPGR